jgi:hypothetical protein
MAERDPQKVKAALKALPPPDNVRPYQVEAIQAIETALLNNRRRVLAAAATGASKTRMTGPLPCLPACCHASSSAARYNPNRTNNSDSDHREPPAAMAERMVKSLAEAQEAVGRVREMLIQITR